MTASIAHRRTEGIIMKLLTSAFFVATLGLSTAAWATDPPPRVGATRPAAAVPAQPKAMTEEQVAAARKKLKRRAVYQHFDEIPMRTMPPAPYGPRLATDGTAPISPLPRTELNPSPPVILNCVGSACQDANGGSHRGGVGTTLMSPAGRICVDNGLTVQCH